MKGIGSSLTPPNQREEGRKTILRKAENVDQGGVSRNRRAGRNKPNSRREADLGGLSLVYKEKGGGT